MLPWSVAATTGVSFFGTPILLELAHALAARAARLPVPSVTLFALGGGSVTERDGRVAGLVTPQEIMAIPRREGETRHVADVIRPLGSLRMVGPQDPRGEPLEPMGREDLLRRPVVEDGRLAGVQTRADILRVPRARRELAHA